MIYIAHRGNYDGQNLHNENTIHQINKCLNLNYDVEIDVWYVDNKFYLGHDAPNEVIKTEFLKNPKLWCHAKNKEALIKMIQYSDIHCFWHEQDKYTLTSRGFIWAYPGQKIGTNTICVKPEICDYSLSSIKYCYGICSDHIIHFIDLLRES